MYIKNILDTRPDFPLFLQEIAAMVPEGVIIDTLFLGRGTSEFFPQQGITIPGGTSSYDTTSGTMDTQGGVATSSGQKEPLRIEIEVACFCNYEEAMQRANEFKAFLQGSQYFSNVEIEGPELETITPQVATSKGIILTEVKERKFTLRAELIEKQ